MKKKDAYYETLGQLLTSPDVALSINTGVAGDQIDIFLNIKNNR